MAEKPKHSSDVPGLVDICANEAGKPVFLIYEEGELESFEMMKIGEMDYIPPKAEHMPWALPRAEKVIHHYNGDDDATLFEDIATVLRNNVELPDPNLYPFLSAWVLHTHILEKFRFSPIILFYAVAARGKTRTGCLLTWMSRRGFHVETIREADIIRKSARFGATYFFDVMDIWKKAERMGSEDILLGRFGRGVTISRVLRPEKDDFDDTRHFMCFGASIIASNEPPSHILDSRSVTIRMRESDRVFQNDIEERDVLELRERCVAFRARWLKKSLPVIEKPARHRLGDILRPIAQIITVVAPDKMPQFRSLIQTFQEDMTNCLADTPEGRIVKQLLNLESEVKSGIIITDTLTKKVNEEVPERYHSSSVSVGKRMGSLGFINTKLGNERGFYYDKVLLSKLAEQYGVAISKLPEVEAVQADNAGESETSKEIEEAFNKILLEDKK